MNVIERLISILKECLTVSDWILLVTGGILLWYTIETRRLRIVSGKQLKIDIRPVMVAIERSNSLTLKNIGRSPALNVTVKDVFRHDEMCFKFGTRTVWAAGEVLSLLITPHKGNEPITSSGAAETAKSNYLSCRDTADTYEVVIDYNDVEMGRWRSICVVASDGVQFKEVRESG